MGAQFTAAPIAGKRAHRELCRAFQHGARGA